MSRGRSSTVVTRSFWIVLVLALMAFSALNWPDGRGHPRIAAADNTVTVDLVQDGESAGINFVPTNVSFDPPSCNVLIGTGDVCTDILTVQNTGIEFTYTISAWVDSNATDDGPAGPEGDALMPCFNIHLTQDTGAGQPVGNDSGQGPFGPLPLAVGGEDVWRLDANLDDDNACQGLTGTLFVHVSAVGVAAEPTETPTDVPTETPTDVPTETPTDVPTETPTDVPTPTPTEVPTETPTDVPTETPTEVPAATSTSTPVGDEVLAATEVPTSVPTAVPTVVPTPAETPVPEPTESAPAFTEEVLGEVETATPGATPAATSPATNTPTPTPTPSPTPTQEVAAARVDLGPPETFLTQVPGFGELSTSLAVIGTNLFLALLALLILLMATTMFNATLKENAEDFEAALGRIAVVPQVATISGAFGWLTRPETGSNAWLSRLKPAVIVLLTAGIYAALDPDFGLNNQTLVLVTALIAGIAGVTFLYEGGQVLWSTRRYETPAAMRIYPVAILIAVACVALTKVTDLHPGIIFGFVTAAAIFPRTALSKREEGLLIIVPLTMLMLVSLAAFLLIDPLREFSESNPGVWATLPETIAVALFVGGAESALLILIPFRFNDGEKVWAWNKALWFAFAIPATFAFFHVLVNDEDLGGLTGNARTLKLLAVCIAVLGIAVMTWAYFWWKNRGLEE
jgi:hypothetical protein